MFSQHVASKQPVPIVLYRARGATGTPQTTHAGPYSNAPLRLVPGQGAARPAPYLEISVQCAGSGGTCPRRPRIGVPQLTIHVERASCVPVSLPACARQTSCVEGPFLRRRETCRSKPTSRGSNRGHPWAVQSKQNPPSPHRPCPPQCLGRLSPRLRTPALYATPSAAPIRECLILLSGFPGRRFVDGWTGRAIPGGS